MANIKSQIKRNLQNERARLRNKAVKAELRTRIKSAVRAVDDAATDSEEAVRLAVKRLDKAAATGVIHKNQAANRKSRLLRRVSSATAPPPAKATTKKSTGVKGESKRSGARAR